MVDSRVNDGIQKGYAPKQTVGKRWLGYQKMKGKKRDARAKEASQNEFRARGKTNF